MASIAYSTWKSLPSGEKVLTPLSYSDLVRNICRRNSNNSKASPDTTALQADRGLD